jgi:hypothetical protein
MSADDKPVNKILIANSAGFRQYTNTPNQISAPIRLENGQRYYIEALLKLKDGPQNKFVSVAWNKPGDIALPTTPIPGQYLAPYYRPTPSLWIWRHPEGRTISAGTNLGLRVIATGPNPITYQWYGNGEPLLDNTRIQGTASPQLLLSNFNAEDAGTYHVVLNDGILSVTSQVATITIRVPPRITLQPLSLTVISGQSATLEVNASGTEPLAYQWLLNGNPLAGATNRNLNFVSTKVNHAGTYVVRISNAIGEVISQAALLTVIEPPMITTSPVSQVVISGAAIDFSVSATGTPPLAYQWFFNAVPLVETTNAIFKLTNLQPAQAGEYCVTVSNLAGSVTSSVAVLTVRVPPAITLQPVPVVVIIGQDAVFEVNATGTEPLLYQWLFNGVPLVGTTNEC